MRLYNEFKSLLVILIGCLVALIAMLCFLSLAKSEEVISKLSLDSDLLTDDFQTEYSESRSYARIIGQLSNGILEIIQKRKYDKWYYCGKLLTKKEKRERSISIAYQVISSQRSIGLDNVSPWGILATIYNESGFDACALGINPRKWAYKTGLLHKNKSNITHTREEIINFIKNPKAKKRYSKSGFDLGYCQILSSFYRGQEQDMLSNDEGIRICIIEMQRRSQYNKTNMPWLYWKGTFRTQWYRNKIRRWAKIMGVPRKEMHRI
jgi:hypothetical protein